MFRSFFAGGIALLTVINSVSSALLPDVLAGGHWIDTWATMPQLTEPGNLPPAPFTTSDSVFANSTIRQTIHTSVGANQIRIRLTNAFGTVNLPVTSVTVALAFNNSLGQTGIQPSTLKTVTFSGSRSTIVPNGALVVSDPIDFKFKPQSVLSISIYLKDGQLTNYVTSHPGSRTTSWFGYGDQTSAVNITGSVTGSVAHWYFLSSVEAWVSPLSRTFSIIGDSITDGRGSTPDGNNRWPDLLLAKLQANPFTSSISLSNQAAGGNRILADGLGPNAQGRVERDVLAHAGVGYALIFEGVNDIGTAAPDAATQDDVYNRLVTAYEQIISRVHTFGIPLFAATITPFMAPANVTIQPYSDPGREVTRQKINKWIRTSGKFDAVVDFDQILADPANPSQLNPLYNGGDYLHPNVAGYQRIADKFPLDLFTKFALGVSAFS